MRDAGYRTREEVEEWVARGPIKRFRERLVEDATATEQELDQIDEEVKALVAEAHEFAQSSPWPGPATVTDHIYSTPHE
jgi:pyruvate dehydrogenase E1 component alpha subunit